MKPNSQDETLFDAARRLVDADQRRAFLDQACKDNPDLRQRVEALLAARSQADQFFAEGAAALELPPGPPPDDSATPPRANGTAEENPGDYIGRYKLREKIGEGGCGVVYVAEQEEPVRRRVALKIIKLGMDTKQVIARFEAERQALAMMDHPNIAKVFDGGATEGRARHSVRAEVESQSGAQGTDAPYPFPGRPYFVMELVRGIKLTEYCDQNRLDTSRRLELFIQVCQAVQHAHQKGIIHRDLKPSNILVTSHDGTPVPKVIDFGIAKATEGRLTDLTIYTELHQFIGTPAYMSPEQAGMSGLDVDTRSDIYSLGVLLYELLTGRTPFDPRELLQAGVEAMRKTIRETEPPRPSTRVAALRGEERSTTALRHATEPPRLVSLLRGDLDWIVMKCLEKDRTRRYETANGLARDIERHLNSEPVVARPPSSLYRFQKLVRRNKLVFAAGGAVAAALVVGLVFALVGFGEARRERDRALAAEQQAEANEKVAREAGGRSSEVAQYLVYTLRSIGLRMAGGGETVVLREVLSEALNRMDSLKGNPGAEADIRIALGGIYAQLGEYANAEAMNQAALALRERLHPEDHLDVVDALYHLGDSLRRPEQATTLLKRALAIQRKHLSDKHPTVLFTRYALAGAYLRMSQLDQAEQTYQEIIANSQGLNGSGNDIIALSLSGLGTIFHQQGKLIEAQTAFEQALLILEKSAGNVSHLMADSLFELGCVLESQERFKEAERIHRKALATYRQALGGDHPGVVRSLGRVGAALEAQGKIVETEAVTHELLAIRARLLQNDGRRIGESRDVKHRLPSVNPAGDHGAISAGRESPVDGWLGTIARALREIGEFDLVKAVHLEASHFDDPSALESAAWFLATCADLKVQDGRTAVAFAETAVAATERKTANVLDTLAAAYAAVGRYEEAVSVQQEAIALLSDGKLMAEYESRLRLFQLAAPYREYDRLGNLYRNQGKFADAESMFLQELEMRRIMFGNDDPQVAISLYDVAHALQRQGKFALAEKLAHESLTIREKKLPDHWQTFHTRSLLGASLLAQKKYADAEPLLLSGYVGMKERENKIPAAPQPRLKEAMQRLVQFYEETNCPEQAAEWQQKLAEFEVTEREKKAVTAEP